MRTEQLRFASENEESDTQSGKFFSLRNFDIYSNFDCTNNLIKNRANEDAFSY